jgi:hypothetical protein
MVLACGLLVLCAGAATLMLRDLEVPGLFYDEVIQAEPAVQFLLERGRPSEIPGATSTRFLGRWLPVMTQPYMGALKSHALIPVFALFDATPASLRITTLAWSLVGLVLAVLWARRLLGLPTALLAAAFAAFDPSFLFVGRHDWGSVALGLICRAGGLYLAWSGWTRPARWRLFAAGLLFGLGIYNKIDFAVFMAAAGLALLLVAPRAIVDGLRSRLAGLVTALLGLALGAAPMIRAAGETLTATRLVFRGQGGSATNWAEKFNALETVLDGSYFHRLMLAGGDFDDMFETTYADAVSGPFLAIFLASAVFLGARLLMGRLRGAGDPARGFVLVTTLLTLIGILLTPAAERIHHVMNVYPFPQLVVAIALIDLWRMRSRDGAPHIATRVAAALLAGALLAASLVVTLRTLETIRETGGKGRWSDAVASFAAELETRPHPVVVSLDWGFDGPLRFTARQLDLVEPIWKLRRPRQGVGSWSFDGTPQHVYLLHTEEYAVFDYGASLLDAIHRLPPASAAIRWHRDRSGDPAFLSVRFGQAHRLVYRGSFEIRLQ